MVKVENLYFTYTSNEENGLKNINLHVDKGEFVVLCGRSGCGKTTLTRVLNGLIPHFYEGAYRGNVRVGNLNVSNAELSRTADLIGSVFQNPGSQFFHIDTDGELAFGCENQAMEPEKIRERINQSVAILELEHLTGRNIFELSGGEKQQIACGSVYAANPKVYVLDEPSSNLDARAILRLKKTLKLLKEAGNTIVISEHRLYYLMDLADRFFYMEQGEIKQIYHSEDIRKMPDEIRKELGLRAPFLESVRIRERGFKTDKIAMNIHQLKYKRNKKEVLSIDHLAVPEHGIIAVVGENGAGKSTFAECVSGLLKCHGQILLNGRDCKQAARIQNSYIVMQDVNHQLFCDSVSEEITMGLSAQQAKKEQQLTDAMDLLPLREKHPASLSGGQKQRVAICAALCAGKQWMFYDEPTSGLDYDGMQRFCTLLQANREHALVSFVITHDLELVAGSCTHVLHLEHGKVKAFYQLDGEKVEELKQIFILE